MEPKLISTVESLIHNTTDRIKDVQSNLIPFFNTCLIKKRNHYTLDRKIALPPTYTIIGVEDLRFKNTATPQKFKGIFKKPLLELIEDNAINPFLLFINNKFIKWSDIEIVHNPNYDYIIAANTYAPEVTKIDIYHIPFNISYNENGQKPFREIEMFRFDDEGKLSLSGNYVFSMKPNDHIKMDSFDAPLGDIKGMDIKIVPDKHKLFKENLILFKEGELYTTGNIKIDNLNVLTIDDGMSSGMIEGRIFVDIDSNIPKNNILEFHGGEYLANLIKETNQLPDSDVPYYVKKIKEDFNFDFSFNKSYDQNIRDSIKYIYQYNPAFLYPAFESPIVCKQYTGTEINKLVRDGNLTMLRLKQNNHATFVLPFVNGELYEMHDQIKYTLNGFSLPIYKEYTEDDVFEFVYFQDIDNATITGKVTKEDSLVSLDGYIEKKDLLVYADKNVHMAYPTIGYNSRLAYRIDYTWDQNKQMSFDDDYYYGRPLTFVSKNRFIYCGYNIRQNLFKFKLSDEFKYCDNQLQFVVFINGRKLNNDEYNLTILKNTRPFDDLYLYSAKTLHPGDKLDVFYIPYPLNGMAMYKSQQDTTVSITTNENKTYDIPVPYHSYLSDGNTIEVYSNLKQLIPDTEYEIDPVALTITFKDTLKMPKGLVFKMIYKHKAGFNESGYIYINKDKIPFPLTKELFFVFVNGKKIPQNKIYNISSDCMRITTDINTTYNVAVVQYRDPITDLINMMNDNDAIIDQIVNSVDEAELDKMNNVFNKVSNTEDQFTVDAEKISIINEIVRDFWMKPGINQGMPFVYDYDTDAFISKDDGDNWVIPAADATKFINIVEEEEDSIVHDLDLPHPGTDPSYPRN